MDADLKNFFGPADHEKLLTLVAQRLTDGRVLRRIRAMLKAGSYGKGRLFPSERGTPEGGVVSPLLSNILLTPFDGECDARVIGSEAQQDDWVVTCASAAEAHATITAALRILSELGVQLHPQKTRVVQVQIRFGSWGTWSGAKTASAATGRDPHGCQIGRPVLSPEGNRSSALRIGCASLPGEGHRLRPRI